MHSILAVDDSASMRQMVSFTLRRALATTSSKRLTGRTHGRRPAVRSFDLVLTDQNMPRMDGISLTRKLREAPPVQVHAHPDPDHRVQRPDEAGRPRRRGDGLVGQTL